MMDLRRGTDESQGWMGGGQGWNTAGEETVCWKGKFVEGDTDGPGEGERKRVGGGYDGNAWPESFPEVGGLDRRRMPFQPPRTTDTRGQRKSCSERSLERGAALRETLKVKAAYMSYPKHRRPSRLR